jgi:hypothetical protein
VETEDDDRVNRAPSFSGAGENSDGKERIVSHREGSVTSPRLGVQNRTPTIAWLSWG